MLRVKVLIGPVWVYWLASANFWHGIGITQHVTGNAQLRNSQVGIESVTGIDTNLFASDLQ